MEMSFTGERFVPELRGKIAYEHHHRYRLAEHFVDGLDVLDIASGEGYGSSLLAARARSVIGVDIDDASIDHARARYSAQNLEFRLGSVSAIPVADGSIDVVVCLETLEHVREHATVMQEFLRVLRPGGVLIVSTPNKLVYSDAFGNENPYHVCELYYEEFNDLLKRYFAQTHVLGQRIIGGSAIAPVASHEPTSNDLHGRNIPLLSLSSVDDPEYFIGICTRRREPKLEMVSSFYYDRDDHIEGNSHEGEVAALYQRIAELEIQVASSPGMNEHSLAGRLAAFVALEEESRRRVSELEEQNAALHYDAERAVLLEREAHELHEKNLEYAIKVRSLEDRIAQLQLDLERLALTDYDRTIVTSENDAMRARIATLESVRERLHESASRLRADHESRLNEVSIVLAESEAKTKRLVELERNYGALQSELKERDRRLDESRADAAARSKDLDAAGKREQELLAQVLDREERLATLRYSLDRHAEMVLDLSHATRIAAESNASLELLRSQLEFELASRVGSGEAKIAELHALLSQLFDERSTLAESLQLRERRIASLEDALRGVAADLLRAAEIEKERYHAMHAGLLSSKVLRVRSSLLRNLAAARGRFVTKQREEVPVPVRSDEMSTLGSRKRPRHLRSA